MLIRRCLNGAFPLGSLKVSGGIIAAHKPDIYGIFFLLSPQNISMLLLVKIQNVQSVMEKSCWIKIVSKINIHEGMLGPLRSSNLALRMQKKSDDHFSDFFFFRAVV